MTEPEDPDDLDALVTELNAGARPADASDDGQTTRLRGWLEQAVARSASDLLLVAGAPPSLRVDGAVLPLPDLTTVSLHFWTIFVTFLAYFVNSLSIVSRHLKSASAAYAT